jgi:arylsulfatase
MINKFGVPARYCINLVILLLVPHCLVAERTNVLVILADDLGYPDPGCYGGELAWSRSDIG